MDFKERRKFFENKHFLNKNVKNKNSHEITVTKTTLIELLCVQEKKLYFIFISVSFKIVKYD